MNEQEFMETVNLINEKIKNISSSIKFPSCKDEILRQDLTKQIIELMELIRSAEKVWAGLPKPYSYISGKTVGRLEMLYSLIAKGLDENKKN